MDFEGGATEMEPTIAAKRAAFLAYKKDPTAKTFPALHTAHSKAQRVARRCANDYWLSLFQAIDCRL